MVGLEFVICKVAIAVQVCLPDGLPSLVSHFGDLCFEHHNPWPGYWGRMGWEAREELFYLQKIHWISLGNLFPVLPLKAYWSDRLRMFTANEYEEEIWKVSVLSGTLEIICSGHQRLVWRMRPLTLRQSLQEGLTIHPLIYDFIKYLLTIY